MAAVPGNKRQASHSPPRPTSPTAGEDKAPSKRAREASDPGSASASHFIPILDASRYKDRASSLRFQQPVPLTTFSYDEERVLHHDDRSLRYYRAPPPRADLNYGFERRVERDDSVNEHLDGLLASLIELGSKGGPHDGPRSSAHVITWRGMMTKLCTLIYEQRQGFEMNAMMVGDTMYIEEHVGPAKKADRARQANDERQKRFSYYGYSFESYCCHARRDDGWTAGDAWDGDVNTNVQWCTVVGTKLGSLRLVLGGEVDAVDARRSAGSKHALVEVKTSMQIRNARDEERFETKMLRFYMQSFLLGVPTIVVGFRDPHGYLVTHQEMETLAMPRAVRGKRHAWDPFACFAVALDVLDGARRHVAKHMDDREKHGLLPSVEEAQRSGSYPVFRIAFDPNAGPKQVAVYRLDKDEILHEIKGGKDDGRIGFLTQEYYAYVKAKSEQSRRPSDDRTVD